MAALTGAKLEKVIKRASRHVKEKARTSGASLYYIEDGKRIREAPDGEKFIRIIDSDGKLKEYPFK